MSRVLNNQNKPNEKEPLTQKLVKVGPIPQMNKPETESLGMFWIEILKTVPEGQKTKMTELIIEHQFREQQFQREQQNLERELEREQQNREHREREFQQNREHREREFQREEENYQQHKKLLELKMRLARDPDNQTLKSEIKAQDEFLEKCVLLMPKHTDKSVEDGEPNLTKKTKLGETSVFFGEKSSIVFVQAQKTVFHPAKAAFERFFRFWQTRSTWGGTKNLKRKKPEPSEQEEENEELIKKNE